MKPISCMIIDDEPGNRQGLAAMLKRHCPALELVAEAESVDDAYVEIKTHRPNLLFLDISMPGKNGFTLLEMFTEIDFEVIFVTAYNEFAIAAFEFNAIGYILKPIDYSKLIAAVEKATRAIQSKTRSNENMIHFVSSLDDKKQLLNKIMLHHNDKVILLELKDICYVEAKGESSLIHTLAGEKIFSSKPLRSYDELLQLQAGFIRINKSVLINLHFLKAYSKGTGCYVTLKNNEEFRVSRRKKSEIIEKLKEFTGNR